MPAYTLIPRPDGGYDIQIVGADGAHQTMLGFRTEADANAWIAEDKRLAAIEDQAGSDEP
jgi:hypothetical protein